MSAETSIHPSAIVEPGAQLGVGVTIGPFCHVGPDATLGDGVRLLGSVTVLGATTLGQGCTVFPTAVLGAPPQNTRHKGGRTTLVVGANTTIREGVTMHAGSDSSRGETVVGENGNFLAYSHVAHDCVVGRNVTFANAATLAGHCEVGDNVIIGGLSAVHQFVRIGDGAFVGGCSGVGGDVIPFGFVLGAPAKLRGLNVVGLRRSGMGPAEVRTLRQVLKTIFDPGSVLSENLAHARQRFADFPPAAKLFDFIDAGNNRSLALPRVGHDVGGDDDPA